MTQQDELVKAGLPKKLQAEIIGTTPKVASKPKASPGKQALEGPKKKSSTAKKSATKAAPKRSKRVSAAPRRR